MTTYRQDSVNDTLSQQNVQALSELQSKKQWVCWCYEPDDNGRKTKVPYQAKNGYKASTRKPQNWASHEDAVKAQKFGHNADGKPYDGIGFVFNDDYTGIDWDHCINEDGSIEPWAKEDIDQLATFCEKSPSDTGIHGITRALLPEITNPKGEKKREGKRVKLLGKNHPDAAIEMYCQGRFFTITGNHLPGTPETIEDRQEAVTAFHKKYFTKSTQESKHQSPHVEALSDHELIEKACNASNGTQFRDLWLGNTGAYGDDESAADLAFCNLLAFWTGKDASRMDRLFRQSGLYREKWDRNARSGETYGEGTIREAIAGCKEVYDPVGHKRESSPTADKAEEYLRKALPEFVIKGQLRDQTKRALEVLKIRNEKDTRLFVYLSTISKIEYDEKGDPIIMQLDKAALRNELSDAADFKVIKKGEPFDAHPPKDLAEQLLALAPRKWGLPPLKAIVEAPVLRPDGSILNKPGYDQKTGLYYIPSPGMEHCVIPENPSQQDAIEAMGRIKALFADFPFEGPADYANTIALLFTPFVRYAVKRDIQMALIDATNAGTGKGLITIVVSIIATGRSTTPISAKQNDEEWRKAIFAELLRAPRIVIIDNIRGTLESATLELMLTGNGLNERILGHSKSASPKNEATWMATGNNLLVGGDLPRRCFRVRLISQTATPEERDDFAIKDLEQHTIDTRPEYVSDVLTVARAWHIAGKPQPSKVPNLGTFTDWAKTIGGMLEFAGVEGFQSNRAELRSRNNEDAQQWEAFLSAIRKQYGNEWNIAGTIAKEIRDQSAKAKENSTSEQSPAEPPATPLFDSLPLDLKKALAVSERGFTVSLSKQLQKRVQTVYGKKGYRIETKPDSHRGQDVYRVTLIDPQEVAGDSASHSKVEKNDSSQDKENRTDESPSSVPSENSENINDPLNLPQPPATADNSPVSDSQNAIQNLSTSGSIVHTAQMTDFLVAGGSDETSPKSPLYRIPSEHLALFVEYQDYVTKLPVEAPLWRAPDSGHPCHRLMRRDEHIQFTRELLRSDIPRRIKAAVEAMHRTLGTWED